MGTDETSMSLWQRLTRVSQSRQAVMLADAATRELWGALVEAYAEKGVRVSLRAIVPDDDPILSQPANALRARLIELLELELRSQN